MVKERLDLKNQPEVLSIFKHIDNENNFLLSGGAGSGKTYSLVSVIQQVIKENPTTKIACMTYTNAAVKEIEERVNHKNLKVSTIHDFLWDCIKNFQNELKISIIDLAKNGNKNFIIDTPNISLFDEIEIQYKEFVRLREGIISHDELLSLSEYMYSKYIRLCDITKDKFKFIFIDEYQDTNEKIVEIFLNHLKKSKKKSIIGFFGDTMQSIYEDGIGNLNLFIGSTEGKVREVKKEQNRRNPEKIYNLANKLRTDGIIQTHSTDKSAPNMLADGSVKKGRIQFLHSKNYDLNDIREYLEEEGWDIKNSEKTKELNLTHNLIASEAGFNNLMEIYDKDIFIKHLSKVRKYLKLRNIIFEDDLTVNFVLTKISDDVSNEIISHSLPSFTVLKYLESLKTKYSGYSEEISNLITDLKPITENKIVPEKIHLVEAFKAASGINEVDYIFEIKTLKDVEKKLDKTSYDSVKNKSFNKFRNLYIDKDRLVDDKKQSEDEVSRKGSKRDNLIKHLFKIQTILENYNKKKFPELFKVLRKNNVLIDRIRKKQIIKDNIEDFLNNPDVTIGDTIEKANELGLVKKDDRLDQFIDKYEYIYNKVKEVSYQEFICLFNYLEGQTPFSTQHKTKGAEFENVLVVLDNGNWSNYNFDYLFTNRADKMEIVERTKKIFYVCCTRAKENLAVFYNDPSPQVLQTAKDWFEEIIDLDRL
ncbi:UvrD-helicase domain-containing protein [Chryseobacterium indoltheticum]|jgi:superfamily I DNA/RNA helicase|uniref:UvrD-helicase domain-containing protein n=1 Tax=Chryseobacterium indoltheticum TaxID=254 RepID=UPI002432A3E5|nr:UvrD-helicase domain-containing protein [Chryseobacterium indoltheticum]MDF2833645.1 ATP-dependent helicase [Chryseobacterium indoltheticum]